MKSLVVVREPVWTLSRIIATRLLVDRGQLTPLDPIFEFVFRLALLAHVISFPMAFWFLQCHTNPRPVESVSSMSSHVATLLPVIVSVVETPSMAKVRFLAYESIFDGARIELSAADGTPFQCYVRHLHREADSVQLRAGELVNREERVLCIFVGCGSGRRVSCFYMTHFTTDSFSPIVAAGVECSC